MSIESIGGCKYIVKLNERVVIISEANMSRLLRLYGKVDIDELSRVVNNHLKVAIDEIEEDCLMRKNHCCSNCEFMKMYDYGKKIYYCDHEDRTDDIEKLSVENPPKTSPVWCPIRKFDNPHSINKSMLGI